MLQYYEKGKTLPRIPDAAELWWEDVMCKLMNFFAYANNVVKRKTDVETAVKLTDEMLKMDLAPSKLDIGLLTAMSSAFSSSTSRDIINQNPAQHSHNNVLYFCISQYNC